MNGHDFNECYCVFMRQCHILSGESMTTVRKDPNALGTKIVKLQEEYEGIQVFDGVVTIREDANGRPTGDASGRLVQDIAEDLPDVQVRLTDEETLEVAIIAEGDQNIRERIGDVSYKKIIYVDKLHKAHLANYVIYLIDSEKRPSYMIDLKSGEVLAHWNALDTFTCGGAVNFTCGEEVAYRGSGGNKKMGRIVYGAIPYCLNMTIEGDTCYLENQYVRIVDARQTEDESIVETASYNCMSGYDDRVNEAYSPVLDAFFYGTLVGKMFEEWFESEAFETGKIVLRVHWGHQYANAFWNGANTTFGDGDYEYYPFTTLDIVGHEVAHGVTEFGSGLVYYDESGGVNEAFSDIIGETVEAFFAESDFITGVEVMKVDPYIRTFESPEDDGYSIRFASNMTAGMNPHWSSGVFRRAFYVTVKVEGFPIKDAATVYLLANRYYWHPSGTFYDCSCGVLKAAIDLGYNQTAFKRGFSDVGIEPCDVTDHIFTLPANETQPNVKVSSSVRPVFRIERGWWTDQLFVEAIAHDSTPITIVAQAGEWSEDVTGNSIVYTGDGTLWVDAWDFDNGMYFQLRSDFNHTTLVNLTAGYTSYYW